MCKRKLKPKQITIEARVDKKIAEFLYNNYTFLGYDYSLLVNCLLKLYMDDDDVYRKVGNMDC